VQLPIANSRQLETQQIVQNYLHKLEQLLKPNHPHLFIHALNAFGLSEKSQLSQSKLDLVLRYIKQQMPSITLELFSSLSLMDFGLVGYAAANADTVGDALRIMNNYHTLTSDRFRTVLEVNNDMTHIFPVANPAFLAEFIDIAEDHLAGSWNLIRQLIDARIDVNQIQVSLAYTPPPYQSLYQSIFGEKVSFNAAKTELIFPFAWLTLPVTSANAEVAKLSTTVCERLLGPTTNTPDTKESVRTLLLSRQGRSIPNVSSAAKLLNLSTEQFRKRLWRQGSSYKALVLEARMILGKNYLEATNLSIQEIAYVLDYSQPGAFSRAFKKFYGSTPIACRETGLENDPS